MKKIAIVWTIILIVIIGGLTIIGLKFKSDNIDNIMEEELVNQAKKYMGYYVSKLPSRDTSIKIRYDELKDEGYDAKLEDGCDGYVVVSNKASGYSYEAYISCPNYKTEGYTLE